ncbi:putative membrane protein [Natronoarchaeum philippinense]|uniref:Putative membrane protein n=1 Tax=Natronoarchaeum philippinense TaxID=558529 RepID=A0A285N1I5_NATPI|nr:DUF368 domain-containing protein [Natronoarchaeum philippinense]SNZ03322.1 putative membrane protein [Natronoarchaeum philippinense]
MRRWLSIYLKGIFMGSADIVPGVSGGTIALITGIYERLIAAITNADPRLLRHALRPHDAESRAALADGLREMDIGFLLALGAGIATAIVGASQIVGAVAESYPGLTAAFFVGLIGASAVVLARQVSVDDAETALIVAVGITLAGSMAFLGGSSAPHALPLVFLAGMVAVSATILPGVSGAFFLLVLGQYYFMLDALTAFLDALVGLASGGGVAALLDSGVVVVTFCSGALVGVLSIAHAVKWALDHHRQRTLAFLVALMIGGVLVPGRDVASHVTEAGGGAATASAALAALAVAGVGAAAVLAIDHYTDDLDYAEDDDAGRRARDGEDNDSQDDRQPRFDAASEE